MNPFAQQRRLAEAGRGRDEDQSVMETCVQPLNQAWARDYLWPAAQSGVGARPSLAGRGGYRVWWLGMVRPLFLPWQRFAGNFTREPAVLDMQSYHFFPMLSNAARPDRFPRIS
jgi:hypothetical protein